MQNEALPRGEVSIWRSKISQQANDGGARIEFNAGQTDAARDIFRFSGETRKMKNNAGQSI